MRRWLWLSLVLVAGCHRVFGVDPPDGDDAPPGDGGGGEVAPSCETWFDLDAYVDTVGIPAPNEIAAGHLYSLDSIDLVVSSSTTIGAGILRGLGAGRFAAAEVVGGAVAIAGANVVLGDVDGDGDDDIVLGTNGGSIEVVRSVDNTFMSSPFPVGSGAIYPVLFDRSPGLPKLAAASSLTHEVTLYGQGAAFGFTQFQLIPSGPEPRAIAAGDLDGDQLDEIVTANAAGDSITVLSRQSSAFVPDTASVGPDPRFLAFGKLDGDDYQDLVVGKTNGQIEIIRGDMSMQLALIPVQVSDALSAFAVASLDGDDIAELVVLDNTRAQVHVIVSPGTMEQVATPFPLAAEVSAMVLADVTGDQRRDLVLAMGSGGIRVYPNCR